jgi:ABC-type branched-subunit amino acid transport system substrate-binding protein
MTWRAIARLAWALAIKQSTSGRAIADAKAAFNTDGQKMIATRVKESYASLFLTSKHDDGSRHAAIARIRAFEVRLLEMPSVNPPEGLSLWGTL